MHDGVYFIEIDRNTDIYNTSKYAFLEQSLTPVAKRLYRIPMRNFIEFGRKLEDRNVVWLFHTTRCGSTAWTQVFNSLPDWGTLAEPPLLQRFFEINVNNLYIPKFVKTQFYQDLVEAIIKVTLKNFPKSHRGIFWKTQTMDDQMVPVIRKIFPKHRLLLGTRDVAPSGKSFYHAFRPFFQIGIWILNSDPLSTASQGGQFLLLATNGELTPPIRQLLTETRPQGLLEWFVLFWALKVRMYQRTPWIHVRYEDLMTDPKQALSRVFSHLEIAENLLDVGMKALESDSQETSIFAKKKREHFSVWVRTEESVARCNRILEAFDLPHFDESYVHQSRAWDSEDF